MSSIPQPRLPLGKTCPDCGQWKLLEEFHRNRSTPDGHQGYCKPCLNARTHARYFANLEKSRAEARAKVKRYADRNKETVRQRYRDWYAAGGDDWHREWQKQTRERTREVKRARYWSNPDRARAESKHRHAMRLGAEGSHTQEEWEALCVHHGGRCLACGQQKTLTRDHVIPLTLGGGDGIENIQPLCGPCNSRKNARTIDYRKDT